MTQHQTNDARLVAEALCPHCGGSRERHYGWIGSEAEEIVPCPDCQLDGVATGRMWPWASSRYPVFAICTEGCPCEGTGDILCSPETMVARGLEWLMQSKPTCCDGKQHGVYQEFRDSIFYVTLVHGHGDGDTNVWEGITLHEAVAAALVEVAELRKAEGAPETR